MCVWFYVCMKVCAVILKEEFVIENCEVCAVILKEQSLIENCKKTDKHKKYLTFSLENYWVLIFKEIIIILDDNLKYKI